VGGENVVVAIQCVANGHAGSFLADINVKVAANQTLVFVMEADAMFLGTANHQHPAQNGELPVSWNFG
jgi:hypothetical protein